MRWAPLRRTPLSILLAVLLASSPNASHAQRSFAKWPIWNDGGQCDGKPDVESFWLTADSAVLRESLCVTAEAPILYLLFGDTDALLIDSGDGAPGLAPMVSTLIEERARRTGRPLRRLIVAHTHAHGDHTRGDAALAPLPNTTLVGLRPANIAAFFGMNSWPTSPGRIDLGARVIELVGIPGHEPSHVAFFDRRLRLLFSGDTLYPGRIYVPRTELDTFRSSVSRLATLARVWRPSMILGAHIELPLTGPDFPAGVRQHPNERSVQLTLADLFELERVALAATAGGPSRRSPNFILALVP